MSDVNEALAMQQPAPAESQPAENIFLQARALGSQMIESFMGSGKRALIHTGALAVGILGTGNALSWDSSAEASSNPGATLLNYEQTHKNIIRYNRDGKVCHINCHVFGLGQAIEVEDVSLVNRKGNNYVETTYVDEIGSANSAKPIRPQSIQIIPERRQSITYVHTPITQYQFANTSSYTRKNAKSYKFAPYHFGQKRMLTDPTEPFYPEESADVTIHTLTRLKSALEPSGSVQNDAFRVIVKGQPLSPGYGGVVINESTVKSHTEIEG